MKEQVLKTKKQIRSILFLVVISLAAFLTLLRGYSFSELFNALKKINLLFLLPGASMMFIFLACEAINISLILRSLDTQFKLRRCFQYACIGYYFGSITPAASGGQPAQIYYMKKDKVPVSLSSVSVFYMIFVYQIAMVSLGFVMSIARFNTAMLFISKLKYLLIVGATVNIGLIIILFAFMFSRRLVPKIAFLLIKAGVKLHIIKKPEEAKSKLAESLITYHEQATVVKTHPALFFKVFIFSVVQVTALCMIPYLVFRSMGFQGNAFDFITCQSLLSISLGAIPLPGSEGFAESGFIRVFGSFFPEGSILTAMIINRILSFYLPLMISFIVYIFVHLRTMRQTSREEKLKLQIH